MTDLPAVNADVQQHLKHMPDRDQNGIGQYRIVNAEGLVYSRFNGWCERNGDLFGHQFHQNELATVQYVLERHGFTNTRIEKDPTGATLNLFLPFLETFGNPAKFIPLLFFTVIFLLAAWVMQLTDLPKLLMNYAQHMK